MSIADFEIYRNNLSLFSLLPMTLYVFGFVILYLMVEQRFGDAFLIMLFAFMFYVVQNIILRRYEIYVFDEFLGNMAEFLTFGVTTILFGVFFYSEDIFFLFIAFFYAFCILFSFARNWMSDDRNFVGFPAALNGLFFPLLYFVYDFFLKELGYTVFLAYFTVVGVLSISNFSFLSFEDGDEVVYEAKKEGNYKSSNETNFSKINKSIGLSKGKAASISENKNNSNNKGFDGIISGIDNNEVKSNDFQVQKSQDVSSLNNKEKGFIDTQNVQVQQNPQSNVAQVQVNQQLQNEFDDDFELDFDDRDYKF